MAGDDELDIMRSIASSDRINPVYWLSKPERWSSAVPDFLITFLAHPDLSVRVRAGRVLFRKWKYGIPKLVAALKDEGKRNGATEALEIIIYGCRALNKLTLLQIQLKDAVREEDKDAPHYADFRDRVTELLKRINNRRNRLLRMDITVDSAVDRKYIEPPKKPKGGIYRVARAMV